MLLPNTALRVQISLPKKRLRAVNDYALQSYHQTFKSFPPAYVADKNGKPIHSWRVLILPYLEYNSLYRQYDFKEPWDGPHNRKLLSARPRTYVCPSDKEAWSKGTSITNYVAVVGSKTAWPGRQSKSRDDSDLRDNASSTILLTEVVNAGIHWTEPRDLSLSAMLDSNSSAVTVSSKHSYHNGFIYQDTPAANVALVDGSARYMLFGQMPAKRLKRLFTVGGIREEDFDSWNNEQLRFNWRNCVALAVWLVAVGLLLHRAVRSRPGRPGPAVEKSQ